MNESLYDGQSICRLRWLGYGLLLFALIDAIQVLSPIKLTNPAWELQTIGILVERVTVPLIGTALVFFGEFKYRTHSEKFLLKTLSWFCLSLSILFLLMIPLGALSTIRLDTYADQQISKQLDQRVTQLNQLETRLNQADAKESRAIAAQLNQIGLPVNGQNPQELKSEGLLRISQARGQMLEQSDLGRANQQSLMFKNSIRWNLGALIASVLFFYFWKTTEWAR